MARLIRLARPDLESITVEMSAVERSSKKLQISISAIQRKAMTPVANGLRGEVRAVLAPALAAWLPTDVRIEETLTLSSPGDLDVLAIGPQGSAFHSAAQVSRGVTHDNRLSTFETQIHHTRRDLSAAQVSSVKNFFEKESATGHTVFLFPKDAKSTAKALEADPSIEPLDRFTLEMLLMVSNRDFENVAKHFKSSVRRLPLDTLFANADRFERTDLDDLWPYVLSLPKRDSEVLGLAQLLDRRGLSDLARQTAMQLHEKSAPAIRLEALLLIERLTQAAPNEKDKPSQALGPLELLEQARAIDSTDIRIALRQAHHAIERGEGEAALSILNAHEGIPQHALGMALRARAMAMTNQPLQQIALTLERARSLAPSDASVAHEAAQTTRLLGDLPATAQHLMDSARIRNDDADLWAQAGEASLLAGNLMEGLACYRLASDLQTDNAEAAQHLLLVATWAGDEGVARIAKERLQDFSESMDVWPIPLADLLPSVSSEHRMALLRIRNEETTQSVVLLEERARLFLKAGQYEETIRDASILEYDYGLQVGRTLAFVATLGLHRNDQRVALLDAVAQSDPEAALTRLELGLLRGDAEVGTLAIQQSHPNAMALREELESSQEAGEPIEGLPTPPSSFVENAWISTSQGVHAWSHPALAIAVLVWKGEAALPATIDALFDMPSQDLDLLPDGTRIVALEGSMLPIHAAIQQRDDLTWISLARTPALTVQALRSFQPAP
jgi:tetratricopeptide (TPR) repeat protein